MNVVIIEDEKLTAKDLAATIAMLDDEIEIVQYLHSVEESIAYLKKAVDIDLIFSDIQLGDGLSFEIFEKVPVQAPIVFCTAYDQYSLEAFKTFSIDYILKPFSKSSVARTLVKYKKLKDKLSTPVSTDPGILASFRDQVMKRNSAIIVYQRDKVIPVSGESIALFFIDKGVTFAYTFEKKKYEVSETIESLEKSFMPNFFRVNRHILVNRKAIIDATQSFNRKLKINLNIPFDEEVIVGKVKVTSFLEWLSVH